MALSGDNHYIGINTTKKTFVYLGFFRDGYFYKSSDSLEKIDMFESLRSVLENHSWDETDEVSFVRGSDVDENELKFKEVSKKTTLESFFKKLGIDLRNEMSL